MALVALYDELWSGVAVVAAPEVERTHALGHAEYTLWVFAVPMFLSVLVEAPVALWSDTVPRRRVLALGLLALASSLGLCALAETPWLLSLGLACAGASSGVACATAQAELVFAHVGRGDRALNRWVLSGTVGDIASPLAVAAAAWVGVSHRWVLGAVALAAAWQARVVWRSRAQVELSPALTDRDPSPNGASRTDALARAAREPRVWAALFGATCCALLDEIAVALSALRLYEIGVTKTAIGGLTAGFAFGAFLGAVALEGWLERFSRRALLVASALSTLLALGLLIASASALPAAIALVWLGASAAPHYALVKATAYELVPDAPGAVNALYQVFVVLDVAMPLAVGAVASGHGLGAALAMLSAQPLVVMWVALFACASPGRGRGASGTVEVV